MEQLNKTISEYIDSHQLEIGGYLYSYALGVLTECKFMKIVKSEYNDMEYALLKPTRCLSYERKKWDIQHGYENERYQLKACISTDLRFNVNQVSCLQDAIKSLENHIKSSTWQLGKAKTILRNIKS